MKKPLGTLTEFEIRFIAEEHFKSGDMLDPKRFVEYLHETGDLEAFNGMARASNRKGPIV